MLFLLLGCLTEKQSTSSEGRDQFQNEQSLRITAPANGEIVDSPFDVHFEAGGNVSQIRVEANGVVIKRITNTLEGSFSLELAEGSQSVKFVAVDANDHRVDSRTLALTVDPTEYFVTITSPATDTILNNPVQFVVSTSSELETIEFFEDGVSIGTTAADAPFSSAGIALPRAAAAAFPCSMASMLQSGLNQTH